MKKLFLSFLVIFFIAQTVSAQVYFISTIAGNDTVGFKGDNGQATAAELNNPIHSAPDKLGNLYIADNINQRVRKVDVNGVITTIAGTGGTGNTGDGGQATNATLNAPVGVAVDDSGNLYICNRASCVVRKVNTGGVISTIAGNGTPGFSGDGAAATKAQLGEPRGVALDDSGNVYIADNGNSCVRKVNKKTGIITTVAGMGYNPGYSGDGGPATNAKLNFAAQLAIDDSGNIFIDDLNNNVVRKVNTKGIISTFAGNGTAGFYGDSIPATNAELNTPLGVAVDKNGNVFITDYYSQRVRKVDKNGIITTIAGTGGQGHTGDGGLALSATMYSSAGINTDTLGNLYVSELASPGNDDIRKLTPCVVPLVTNPPPTLCSGQSAVLKASGAVTYQWGPSGGLSATTGDSIIANPTATATYMVTATDSIGCYVTKNIVVTVAAAPGKPLFHQHGDTLISSSEYNNQWYRNDTLLTDTSQHLIITVLGSYWVVVANEANGCSTPSDTMTITSLTGINRLSANNSQLSVYPNPFNNTVFIKINSSMNAADDWNLLVTDVLGRTLFTMPPLNPLKETFEIDLSNLTNGVYFITVVTKTGRMVVPVVKQN